MGAATFVLDGLSFAGRNPVLRGGIPLGFFRPANDKAEENWRYDRQAPVLIRRCAQPPIEARRLIDWMVLHVMLPI